MNKALEALKEIEWIRIDGQITELCPICKRSRYMQHSQWCRLDRAIGFLERQPKCKTCGDTKKVTKEEWDDTGKSCNVFKLPCPDCAEQSTSSADAPTQAPEAEHGTEFLSASEDFCSCDGCGDPTDNDFLLMDESTRLSYCSKCRNTRAKQPPESRPAADKVAPEAERPSTCPDDVPSEAKQQAEYISGLHDIIARLEAQLTEQKEQE